MNTTLHRLLSLLAPLLMLTMTVASVSAADPTSRTPFEQACEAVATGTKPDSDRLHDLFAADWEYRMREYPEWATATGYPGQNHRWTDLSEEAIARRRRELQAPLRALLSIRRANLAAADRLHYDLFRYNCETASEGARFPEEVLQITQLAGVHQHVLQVIRIMPKFTSQDGRDIVARLRAVDALVDQTIALLTQGLAAGITPPRITLRDVVEQVERQLVADPAESPLIEPLKDFSARLPAEALQRLRKDAIDAVRTVVLPSYRRLRDFLASRYIPRARQTTALAALPDGSAWYSFLVRSATTTALTPEEIHAIGLAEVERIAAAMGRLIEASGFQGSRAEFFRFLRTDPQFYYRDGEALLTGYRDICKRADPELIGLFGLLPRQPYGVVAVPDFVAKSQPTAYYRPGSTRASRPGYFYVNTYDLPSRPKWEMEPLALHEAVPGHHLQIALADEMEGVPEFRKYTHYMAYTEGWGLYAESLGEEMGFYRNLYAKFGQLTFQMWRAARLVVDTGLHAFGWSRRQAIDYLLAHTGRSEHDATVEVDRYIVLPGQALSYKIGELRIKTLRKFAVQALGERFDLRAFHDEVLRQGALPLGILEERIKDWTGRQ